MRKLHCSLSAVQDRWGLQGVKRRPGRNVDTINRNGGFETNGFFPNALATTPRRLSRTRYSSRPSTHHLLNELIVGA